MERGWNVYSMIGEIAKKERGKRQRILKNTGKSQRGFKEENSRRK